MHKILIKRTYVTNNLLWQTNKKPAHNLCTKFSPFSDNHFCHEVTCSQSLLARQVGLFILKLILACEVFNVCVINDDLGIELDALREPLA